MKKIFFSLVFIFTLTIFFSANAEGIWRLDGTDEKILPRNFRTMTDAWHIDLYVDDGNRIGLENLNASASGQPSLGGISTLCKKIKTSAETDAKIYIVDLREESHGFADNFPVSFNVEKNRGNFYSGYSEEKEFEQLKNLQGNLTEFLPLGNADKKLFKPQKFSPQKISTEKSAVEAEGCIYVRFPATDMIFPSPQVVDEFLNFVKNLPEKSWLHFHCQAGHGRTTTFLAMYDILKNPNLSLEDICKRQYYLGGSNLLEKSSGNDFYAESNNRRVELIKLFYKYAHENHGEKWSEFYSKNYF